jgi:hypothetical protein
MSTIARKLLRLTLALLLLWSTSAVAQQSYYLFLQGKGTACLTISRNTRTAYITDGGDRGRAGIQEATIDGKKVLEMLREHNEFDYLVIACSHPDSDHMAGLVNMVKTDPLMLEFKKVFFVDSGFDKEGSGPGESLADIYDRRPGRPEGQVERMPAKGVDAYQSVGALIPKPKPGEPPNADVHNFVYEIKDHTAAEQRDPHGHSILHHYTLREGAQKSTVADLDDANDALVAKWVAWVKQDPAGRRPDYLVLPHHGSSYTDITPLMAPDVRPKVGCIISVNPNNQYRHPGARNLLVAFAVVGRQNVHITGDGENIVITPKGLPSITDPETFQRYHDKFVYRQIALNDREIAMLEERLAAGTSAEEAAMIKDRVADLQAARSDLLEVKNALRTSDWTPNAALLARLDKPAPQEPPSPEDDPGRAPRPRKPMGPGPSEGRPVLVADRDETRDPLTDRPNRRADTPETGTPQDNGPTPPVSPSTGPVASREGSGKSTAEKGSQGTGAEKSSGRESSSIRRREDSGQLTGRIDEFRTRSSTESVAHADTKRSNPRTTTTANGDNVGNFRALQQRLSDELAMVRPAETTVSPRASELARSQIIRPSGAAGGRFLKAVRLKPVFGGIILGNTASDDSPSPLDAKFQVKRQFATLEVTVDGPEGRKEVHFEEMTMTELWCAYRFVRPDATMQSRFGSKPGECGLVGINTAFEIGWTFGIHPAIADTVLARDGMRLDMVLSLGDKALLDAQPGWDNYQWFDDRAVIRPVHGNLHIEAATEPKHVLMRLRLWGREADLGLVAGTEIEKLYSKFDALTRIDRFARAVAVLNWLERSGHLPELPEEIQPVRMNVPPSYSHHLVIKPPRSGS